LHTTLLGGAGGDGGSGQGEVRPRVSVCWRRRVVPRRCCVRWVKENQPLNPQ
jgi:hypothetical protein